MLVHTPRPRFKDYEELNNWLADQCLAISKKRMHPEDQERTIGEMFQEEQPLLLAATGTATATGMLTERITEGDVPGGASGLACSSTCRTVGVREMYLLAHRSMVIMGCLFMITDQRGIAAHLHPPQRTTSMENQMKLSAELRKRAEAVLRKDTPKIIAPLSPEEIQKTLYALRVHQLELEMQNDELRQTQAELDLSWKRYFDFYNLAPVGYCTISGAGLIEEANLTTAFFLGLTRSELINQAITNFVHQQDQDRYYLFRKKLMEFDAPQHCDLRVTRKDGTLLWVQLHAIATHDSDSAPVCRLVLSDITERKQAEQALRERTAELEKTNATLVMMLDHARTTEADIQERVVANLRTNILGIVDMVKKEQLTKNTQDLVELLESTTRNLAHPFARNLGSQLVKLTPRELQLASFIRLGLSTKEVMALLNVTAKTVEAHRAHLRKKLGIHRKKISLRTFLNAEFSS